MKLSMAFILLSLFTFTACKSGGSETSTSKKCSFNYNGQDLPCPVEGFETAESGDETSDNYETDEEARNAPVGRQGNTSELVLKASVKAQIIIEDGVMEILEDKMDESFKVIGNDRYECQIATEAGDRIEIKRTAKSLILIRGSETMDFNKSDKPDTWVREEKDEAGMQRTFVKITQDTLELSLECHF